MFWCLLLVTLDPPAILAATACASNPAAPVPVDLRNAHLERSPKCPHLGSWRHLTTVLWNFRRLKCFYFGVADHSKRSML